MTDEVHDFLFCEAGVARGVMTPRYKYLFSPHRRAGASPDFGASGRHPALKQLEQLYDVSADPAEQVDLIGHYGLMQPTAVPSENATRAAQTLVEMRTITMRDLGNISRTCGVS
eukprot:CAMPEP_0181169570 /NCGR_PEP_ID=MMETSP1096-20121128/886_1 /TAXON_ID=156174 ORGANISM="Chrysochromulina ericina, Strain CCMP281" /NCGR_SAMPLE_ID=MMETSP1096 /ASSEMBLY_ACC=CAM_ASM_000453 /LENGTH=113 /DNA_ID=CAMNT_0023257039 /DNA_START=11 /DNA_END=352 /DNA_ORIENTATION=-